MVVNYLLPDRFKKLSIQFVHLNCKITVIPIEVDPEYLMKLNITTTPFQES